MEETSPAGGQLPPFPPILNKEFLNLSYFKIKSFSDFFFPFELQPDSLKGSESAVDELKGILVRVTVCVPG